ncbi:helix-turn-helix domain-containing protein [Marinoscillum sp.]|uniref:helix-turn-helix domain-containing protein n=1 Tax=Marinoscillum sp. TaxID=2024838 RepID=UPI003BAC7063
MFLTVHLPLYPINQLVESITYYSNYSVEHFAERLLPDGHADFIVNLTEAPKHTFDNATLQVNETFKKGWLSGARKKLLSIDAGGRNDSMMIVRLKLGAAYNIFKIPQEELTDKVYEADLILGHSFDDLRTRIMEAHFVETKIQVMEKFVLDQCSGKIDLPPVVSFAFDQLVHSPSSTSIKLLADQTGYSHKHFIALFRKHAGMSPKEFLKVMRFQRVLQEIENQGRIDWARLALDCGYYDQAHFIKEFRNFSGFSPEQYLTQKGEYVNYIPVR